jgi:hypothetical protein
LPVAKHDLAAISRTTHSELALDVLAPQRALYGLKKGEMMTEHAATMTKHTLGDVVLSQEEGCFSAVAFTLEGKHIIHDLCSGPKWQQVDVRRQFALAFTTEAVDVDQFAANVVRRGGKVGLC